MSAAVLKERKPDQAEMLDQLAQAVDLDQQGPEAQKIHAQLKASIWTAEDRERGRELGRKVVSLKASDLRKIWRKVAIKAIAENYLARQHLSRHGIILNIHSHCAVEGYTGKGGGQIQVSTISRWFTEKVETEIRLEAMDRLIEGRGILK
jgi:hypothetical protein